MDQKFKKECLDNCHKILPDFPNNSKQFKVKPLTGGLTNLIYLISYQSTEKVDGKKTDKKVLYRKFGPGKSGNFEKINQENEICRDLGEKGIGPKIYGSFDGGRIEEFLENSVPLAISQLDHYYQSIAEKMAKIHQLDSQKLNKSNCLINMLEEFEEKNLEYLASNPSDKESRKLFERFQKSKKFVFEEIITPYSAQNKEDNNMLLNSICFSHNDLQELNIMLNEKSDEIYLIDFEYSGYTYLPYDFANHFSEFRVDNASSVPSGFDFNESLYPALDFRRRFVETYLRFREDFQGSNTEFTAVTIDQFLEQIEKFVMVSDCLWGGWSIFSQNDEITGFDFLAYGTCRLDAFESRKAKIFIS